MAKQPRVSAEAVQAVFTEIGLDPSEIARILLVDERTLRRWQEEGAPRCRFSILQKLRDEGGCRSILTISLRVDLLHPTAEMKDKIKTTEELIAFVKKTWGMGQ